MDGIENMTAEQGRTWCQDIKYLMDLWDTARAAWLERFGNDIGFDKWFLNKIEGRAEQ